jgi:hypothetical protein
MSIIDNALPIWEPLEAKTISKDKILAFFDNSLEFIN